VTLSHRSTTSSRKPGVAIEGAVAIRQARCVRCEKCGGMRLVMNDPHSPHAPRYVVKDGAKVKIDCAGEEVF